MSTCCSSKPDNNKNQKLNCPKCQKESKSVSRTTVLQHLSFPLNTELVVDSYFYCASPDCEVAYFSESGVVYNTSQIRENTEIQQGWLCYCFDISKKQYQHALDTGTASEIKNFVIAQTKSHLCACDIRNPSGQCCLADFKRMEK